MTACENLNNFIRGIDNFGDDIIKRGIFTVQHI